LSNGNNIKFLPQTGNKVEDFKAALGGPMKEETAKDVFVFSNIFPVIWVGEVLATKSYE